MSFDIASYIMWCTWFKMICLLVFPKSGHMLPCISHSFVDVLEHSEYLVNVLKLKMLSFYNHKRELAFVYFCMIFFLHIYGRKIKIYR